MASMTVERDHATNAIRFTGTVAMHDLEALNLDGFDRMVLDDCSGEGRDAADWLLALELIFRRLRP